MASLNIKDQLMEKEEEFHGKEDILGMTGLTNPGYISSSRAIMFTSHLRQKVDLVHQEFPRVFTNMENIVGKGSTGYYKTKSKQIIIDKVPKYGERENRDIMYVLFMYDEDKDKYDIVPKKVYEDLVEKFGYIYNTDVIDSKDIGDKIKKDEVLYKTLSYDGDMNYGYGRNVTVLYSEDPFTVEDAIVVSESFAKKMVSKEIDTVRIPLNDNDILCNLFGDDDNYKCFPDIGENVPTKVIAARRRIHNEQVLFDLKKSNLRKINYRSDVLFYTSGRVINIEIKSNKPYDEIPDNIFYKQLKGYYKDNLEYYQRIKDRCEEIMNSGSKYTRAITSWYQKAKDILDDNTLWREENNSVFSNMVIEITVARDSYLSVGQKITGRQGNKGVVGLIRPDNEMPQFEDGRPVDALINALGVMGRLNLMQSFEQSINHVTNQVVERLKTLDSDKEREELFFDILTRFNVDQAKDVRKYYNKLKNKQEFWEDVYIDKIYIHNKPMWEDKPIFDILRDIYRDYSWTGPIDMYINKFGRRIKIMKPLIVAEIYMMRLKQDSKKGFSARSTGALSKKGVPAKTNKSKKHQDLYSTTPIRIGDAENTNLMIGMDPKNVINLHRYHRSDPELRSYLVKELVNNWVKPIHYKKNDDGRNRNVEVLNALLKGMGLKLEFDSDHSGFVVDYDIGDIKGREFDGYYIDTDSALEEAEKKYKLKQHYSGEELFIGGEDEFEEFIDRKYKETELYNVHWDGDGKEK